MRVTWPIHWMCVLVALPITASDAADEKALEQKPPQITLELRDGSKLVGTPTIVSLPIKTEFAKMDLPMKLVAAIEFADDKQTAKIHCTNGDELKGIINLTAITVGTAFDKVSIPLKNIARISTGAGSIRKGCVLYYSFDNVQGSKVVDSSELGNHGQTRGSVQFGAGVIGRALRLDGKDAYVTAPASESLNVGKGSGLTIAAWISPSDVSEQHPIVEWNNGNYGAHFWIAVRGQGSLYANLVDQQSASHMISSRLGIVREDVFSHVALTYDTTTGIGTLYLNGKSVAEERMGVFTPQTSYNVLLGRRPEGGRNNCYAGAMDEVQIYNRALNASEVEAISKARGAGK